MAASSLAIAIVDDEPLLRRALCRVLQAHGCTVTAFEDGHAFLAEAQRRRFDCVLLDLNMPGISGFDVLAALAPLPDRLPVVVVSGDEDPDYAVRVRGLEAFVCLRKPVHATDLMAAIERACGQARRGVTLVQ